MSAKRIIVKVGSSTLTGSAGTSLNSAAVAQLVDVVADLKRQNKEVIIVTSAAIAAGMAPLGLTERPTDLATQQASASVGQGYLNLALFQLLMRTIQLVPKRFDLVITIA